MLSEKYQRVIEKKVWKIATCGFDCDNPLDGLFDFQTAIVRWALKLGRAAIFADTGLGKTAMQLAWAHRIAEHTGRNVLIVAPLCVAQQTVAEALKFGLKAKYIRSTEEIKSGISTTNYDILHHIDADAFVGVALDESSILKHKDSKTRQYILNKFSRVNFRLSCTATPAPNDFMEIGSQAEFIGCMTSAEMLATFFTHDGGETSKWILKGHGRTKFWEWLATWAVCFKTPNDIGFSDVYELPELRIIKYNIKDDGIMCGELFPKQAASLTERRQIKRMSIGQRAKKASEIAIQADGKCIIWCHLNDESTELAKAVENSVEVTGSQKLEDKEQRILDFTFGDARVLVTKPSIAGHGMNWQHCHEMVFVGLTDSFEEYYQAIRRCWRFGQQKPVTVHVITTENEAAVLRNIERKEKQMIDMARAMVEHVSEITKRQIRNTSKEPIKYERVSEQGDDWVLHLGDCVDVMSEMATESVDYEIFSPPFASLYTYSNSEYDMGNAKTTDEFFEQFKHAVAEMFRILKPGRLLSFHCMNLPTFKERDGFIGIRDFRGQLIKTFQEVGFIYHSEVVIWKDPVTAMQRTKALGLLWKQLKKDSSMSRQGIPDYLVTMRKPGENKKRIEHTAENFPVELWQQYASPVWSDINQSDTLNRLEARETDDERHICPLQLEVIRRALKIWSAPGDVVFSPFAGIGSEGFIALENNRRFIGIELKRSYFDIALKNLSQAKKQLLLFKTKKSHNEPSREVEENP